MTEDVLAVTEAEHKTQSWNSVFWLQGTHQDVSSKKLPSAQLWLGSGNSRYVPSRKNSRTIALWVHFKSRPHVNKIQTTKSCVNLSCPVELNHWLYQYALVSSAHNLWH